MENKAEINTIPIVFSANKLYTPCLFTAILSVLDNGTDKSFYKVFVLHKEIEDETQALFHRYLNRQNSEVVFINVTDMVEGYDFKISSFYSNESFFRLLIPRILKEYPIVIYLDCDIIVCHDIAELFESELGEHSMAACCDVGTIIEFYQEESDRRCYLHDVLNIDNPWDYFQTGVLIIDTEKFRKMISVEYLMELASKKTYRYVDQDILSMVFKGNYHRLEIKWNLLKQNRANQNRLSNCLPTVDLYKEYTEACKNPYIIHYGGIIKPWHTTDLDMGYAFWEVARRTPYYEIFLTRMIRNVISREADITYNDNNSNIIDDYEHHIFKFCWNYEEINEGIRSNWVGNVFYEYILGIYKYEKDNEGCWASGNVEMIINTTDKEEIVVHTYNPKCESGRNSLPYLYFYINGKYISKQQMEEGVQEDKINVRDHQSGNLDFRIASDHRMKKTNEDIRELSYILKKIETK